MSLLSRQCISSIKNTQSKKKYQIDYKKYKVKPPTYLDRLGLTANEAIAEFNKSRGEDQDRQNYLEALRARRQIQ